MRPSGSPATLGLAALALLAGCSGGAAGGEMVAALRGAARISPADLSRQDSRRWVSG